MSSIEFPRISGGPALWNRLGRGALLAPRVVEGLLILLIAILLARAFIDFFAPLPVPKGDVLAARPAIQQDQTTLTARNPFPQAAVDALPLEASPALDETALDLTLTGVWPEEDGGSAIIRRPDGKERRFAVGDEIISGVTLIATYSDQVVIEQNGVRESLRFESKAPVESRGVNAPPASTQSTTTEKIQNLAPDGAPPTNALLGGAFRLAPGQNAAGEPAIQLFAGRDRAAFDAAGLRDGDVLVSINGAALPRSPNDLVGIVSNAAQSGSINLVVERDGARQAIALSANGSGKG